MGKELAGIHEDGMPSKRLLDRDSRFFEALPQVMDLLDPAFQELKGGGLFSPWASAAISRPDIPP